MPRQLQKNCGRRDEASRRCPSCDSNRIWKDGIRKTQNGFIQRYICRDCSCRFSESSVLSISASNRDRRQVCAVLMEAKNLAKVEPLESGLAGATKRADVKGKIVDHLWYLKKQGFCESTIKVRVQMLKQFLNEGVNLLDIEDVKKAIAIKEWSKSTKRNMVITYTKFLEMLKMTWDAPRYVPDKKLPFIPLEKEIDALIAGCGRKTAKLLQLLKETGMRIGEALNLRWIDVDIERNTINCRSEKHGNPRMFKVSTKLIAMLNQLPKKNEKVFGGKSSKTKRWTYIKQRKRIAQKLQNPRLNHVTFHTFRHWKATMEYHRTKDILHVKQLLGHKCIESTLIYTQLLSFEGDEYHVKTAKNLEEVRELAKSGFELFTKFDDVQVFRKRK